MSNDQLRESAQQWAWEYMLCNAELPEDAQDDEYRAAQYILVTIPLTVAQRSWGDEQIFMQGAVDKIGDRLHDVVMVGPVDGAPDYLYCIKPDSSWGEVRKDQLIPNGRRYELREVTDMPAQADEPEQSEPEHPETLRTVEDYENAPEGTIVVAASRHGSRPLPVMKGSDKIWLMTKSAKGRFNDHMAGTEHRVLRWGWGK